MNLRKIKNKVRNALIVLIYFSGLPYVRFLFYRLRGIPLVRILCWHKVPYREQFRDKIVFLGRRFNVVSIEDFYGGQNLCCDKINLVFSFDDGYKNWVENAAPLLAEYDFPALFFITSGYVGLSPEEEKQVVKNFKVSWSPGLSIDDVKSLARREIFSIGAHGRTHLDLTALPDDEFSREIKADRETLEHITGREIPYFAFPFGHKKNFDSRIFEYYSRVFSIIPGFNGEIIPGKVIHRDSIDLSFSKLLFVAWIYGSYDWYWSKI